MRFNNERFLFCRERDKKLTSDMHKVELLLFRLTIGNKTLKLKLCLRNMLNEAKGSLKCIHFTFQSYYIIKFCITEILKSN